MPRGRPRNSGTATAAAPAARTRRSTTKPQVPFPYKLILNQWILSLFNVKRFGELAEHLRGEAMEGLDENNVHRFHHAIAAQFFNLTQLSTDDLLRYDQNIVRHTLRLNERRITRGEDPIVWKYFQYLGLLFTEIYLDRYFTDAKALLAALNAQVAAYNADKPEPDRITPFDEAAEAWPQLNKLAFWMATGSGKTLLMHANILQYQHALATHGRSRELNRILLLTPNEGLSQQHLREFEAAGIAAELFNKDGRGLFSGQAVEVLEVTLLRDEMGEKSVAIDAFEGNNLVLVDEGHRGASGGKEGTWMKRREKLCEKGFSFEYSATFGQAVKGSPALTDLYAKSTLVDYSYKYFYGDGFGKDYQILNLDEGTQQAHQDLYLTACLLTFYQQQRLFRELGAAFRPFNIEKPLWIFVGGSVTAGLATRDASDIVEILKFLARYVADRAGSTERIRRVLHEGLIGANGKDIFARRFEYLNTCSFTPAQIFDETLSTLFHASAGGQLYVENLKGVTGEIALRLGAENPPFGVINVGDDTKLLKLCEENGLSVAEPTFSESLFHGINTSESPVNLLIGSKKFTEGWSSWRVSTMGLMNVGKGEGAQIIQLFGRGVRLKGFDISLKRSLKTDLPQGVERPRHIAVLETLGIFGVHADYMAQFRDFLKEEGLPSNEERIEFLLPVIKSLGTQKLKTVRLKKTINGVSTEFGDAFRKLAPVPTVRPPDLSRPSEAKQLHENRLVLDWYPRIRALGSQGLVGGDGDAAKHETHLSARHVAFLDVDRLYFELERFKAERGWYNLNITRSGIADLLVDTSWYRLQIPPSELLGSGFDKVRVWEEIALALLRKYVERYYTFRKRDWELPHLEYRDLETDDPNFLGVKETPEDGYHRILLDKSQEEIVAKLEELKASIAKGEMKPWEFKGMKAVWFGKHLYQPLLYLDTNIVEISPAPLNRGERQFVEDLRAFHDANGAFFKDRELYLLRNLSRGRGVGFFEAGNFHPDFILWLIEGGKQRVVFVDPKGIRNLPWDDPKILFHETVKEIETRLGDSAVRLDSFIVSNTPSVTMQLQWGKKKAEMLRRNIVFQEEDGGSYVGTILAGSTAEGTR
ncbi:MAG: DEAD/DEAH box helicase family protein [Gemmatimonadaceae bacterium]|nr:DEAD/DEAH box helicase family protein [Gemmatimonadaceae bacterium]